MDSSPVNHYLLFESADVLRPSDKVAFALGHPIVPGEQGSTHMHSCGERRQHLVRSVEGLRRMLVSHDKSPVASTPRATFSAAFADSTYCSPEPSSTSVFPGRLTTHDDADDSESAPWDSVLSGATIWHWPVEVLFQRYHLLVAIDFGFAAFEVSGNGTILMDRVPCAIKALLGVVEQTLRTREEEAAVLHRWIAARMSLAEGEVVRRQVWQPTVDISIVLVNIPRLEEGALASIAPLAHRTCEAPKVHGECEDFLHFLPADAVPFSSLECDASEKASVLPLLTACDASRLLLDKEFVSRLEATLHAYEAACRARLVDDWPDRPLSASMEHIVRLVPERPEHCTSLVLIANADLHASDETIVLLESEVRRKSIIVSLLLLGEAPLQEGPQTNPLSQFVADVGGLAVHLEYWLALAAPQVNEEWCRRFEGPRCLAQQLFVELDSKFPVAVARASQGLALRSTDNREDVCVLYDADNGLPDFSLRNVGDVLCVLKCSAEARVAQGWSVVMEHSTETSRETHLYARFHCHLRRGVLTLLYELNVCYPMVYRRVLAYGTRALLDVFYSARDEDRVAGSISSSFAEANAGWLVHLIVLRAQLDAWVLAEEAALHCLLFARAAPSAPLSAAALRVSRELLPRLSSRDGVAAAWAAHCSQRAAGLFFRWADEGAARLFNPRRAVSAAARAARAVRHALSRRHRPIAEDKADVFVTAHAAAAPSLDVCVVQIFPLDGATAVGHDSGTLAAVIECRMSFFFSDAQAEQRAVDALVADVQAELAVQGPKSQHQPQELTLVLEVGSTAANARALHLLHCVLSPRRIELIAPYSGSHRLSSSRTPHPSRKKRKLQQLALRLGLAPYVVSPWVLADAVTFCWAIGAAEVWRTLGEPCFHCFVTRRVRNGFRLLHCSTQRRAILHVTSVIHEEGKVCGSVDIFDVIDAPLEGPRAGQVIIKRCIRPFWLVLIARRRWEMTADIAEDIKAATVLHTFSALATPTGIPLVAERPVPSRDAQRGVVQLTQRLDALLPFLPAAHAHTIALSALPSLGATASSELRGAVARFVGALAERSATVAATSVRSLLRQRPFPHNAKAMEAVEGEDNVHAWANAESDVRQKEEGVGDTEPQIFVAILRSPRLNCLTFILIPCADNDVYPNSSNSASSADDDDAAHKVEVTVVSLDAAALHSGVMTLYQRGDVDELPDCTDSAMLNALTQLLSAFSALFQASRLLERQREGVAGVDDASVARDLLRVFETFQDYCTEVDVSHLLYVTECRCASGGGNTKISDALSVAVASMAGAIMLQPLPAHPDVFYSTHSVSSRSTKLGTCDEGRESCEHSNGTASRDPTPPPFLVKIALVIVGPSGREEKVVYVKDAPVVKNGIDVEYSNFATLMQANAGTQSDSHAEQCWRPPADGSAARPPQRLLLRLYVRTALPHLVNLFRDCHCPPVDIVRRAFADLADVPVMTRRDVSAKPPSFFASNASVAAQALLHRNAQPFTALPDTVRQFFDFLAADLTRSVARHCLAASLHAEPLIALRKTIEKAQTDGNKVKEAAAAALPPAEEEEEVKIEEEEEEEEEKKNKEEKGEEKKDEVSCTGENLREGEELAQPNRTVLCAAADIPGLCDVLAHAVTPALLSDASFEADSFVVEFTQQSTYSSTVDPTQALLHVLTRCLADDLVCVVPATPSCFLYVPNRAHLAAHWVLVQLNAEKSAGSRRVSLRCHEHSESESRRAAFDRSGKDATNGAARCSQLRRLITDKATEVSQLHLLKQLRDTQNAHKELIPPHWGDQYTVQQLRSNVTLSSPSVSPSLSGSAAGNLGTSSRSRNVLSAVSPRPAAFYCRGVTAFDIPVYYKLQHQCKKMLSRITSNSSRLELINIYNREQCFVVADDVQEDVFHYVRLVFVKDTTHPVSLTAPSPPLSPADRCPILSVQLFSATRSASVARPLRKLRDFCFFLAAQELQGHLNYVQHKTISAVDLMFLQCRRVDSVSEDLQKFVGDGETLHAEDVQLAFALVVLGLKENKFKFFEVEDRHVHHTVSNFIEYYRLIDGGVGKMDVVDGPAEATEDAQVLQQISSGTAPEGDPLVPREVMRFVKTIEGVTDVLVSCSLRVTTGSRLIVDCFLSKLPEERYISGESEKTYLKQIQDVVTDAMLQWRFSALSQRLSSLSFSSVVKTVAPLLDFGARVTSSDSSTLRFKHFPLERLSPVVYPFLIERLAGVFEPMAPICLECRADASAPSHLPDFAWHWIERLQNDPLGDQLQVYITCGYAVTTDDDSSDEGQKVPVGRTRVLRVTHADLPVTVETGLAHSPLLKEHNIVVQSATKPRAVVHIDLARGVTAALFNLRDSDVFLRLMGHVITGTEQQSALLYDIMMQRMGFAVPSSFSENALARMCCGDDSNVSDGMPMKIHDEAYTRRVNNVRFSLKNSAEDDPFTIILEGLFNRGLFVNGSFAADDAVKVLYDECPEYSLSDCQRIVREFHNDGVFLEDLTSKVLPQALLHDGGYHSLHLNNSNIHMHQLLNNAPTAERRSIVYFVANLSSIPDDALIGCSYRRNVQLSHIVVESQHARSALTDQLELCDAYWNNTSRDSCLLLAKAAIMLQLRSKQIFASRVPDFSLRRVQRSHEDDILDPALPSRSQQKTDYIAPVNAALFAYVQHLKFLFPSARFIDIEANDSAVASDSILHNRLRCRYGKVVSSKRVVNVFAPRLYYVLLPIVDVLQAMGGWSQDSFRSLSITEGGLIVVELGYQVVHFALDVFMVKGAVLPPGIVAHASAWLKQSLNFSTVLYDLTVDRLLRYVQMYAAQLSGERQTSAVLSDLIDYYPNPPHNCLCIAASFRLSAPLLRRMSRRRAPPAEDGGGGGAQHLVPDSGHALACGLSHEPYDYGGLVAWDDGRLFVLAAPAREGGGGHRAPGAALRHIVREARRRLLRLLLARTLRGRIVAARERIARSGETQRNKQTHTRGAAGGGEAAAHNAAAEAVKATANEEEEERGRKREESGEEPCAEDLRTVQAHSSPITLETYVEPLALVRAPWAEILRSSLCTLYADHEPEYIMHLVPASANSPTTRVPSYILTITHAPAEGEAPCECFATVEFVDDTLRNAALYRTDPERNAADLSDGETELVDHLLKVLTCALWSSAAPSLF